MMRTGIVWRLNMCSCPSTFCRLDRSYGNCSSWVATFQPTCQIVVLSAKCATFSTFTSSSLYRNTSKYPPEFLSVRINFRQKLFTKTVTNKGCRHSLLYNTSAPVTRRNGIYFFTGWIFHREDYICVVVLSERMKMEYTLQTQIARFQNTSGNLHVVENKGKRHKASPHGCSLKIAPVIWVLPSITS